jgi:hypothetical protein
VSAGYLIGWPRGIEGDDADRAVELALHQLTDQRLPVSGVFIGLAPRFAETAKIIQHEVSVSLRPMGRNTSFGSINPVKGFRLLEAEASHAEVTPRGLHLVQHMVDCLSNIVPFSWFWMIPLTARQA